MFVWLIALYSAFTFSQQTSSPIPKINSSPEPAAVYAPFNPVGPELYSRTEYEFSDQNKWTHSCGAEGGPLTNGTANLLSEMRQAKHYFFFSLKQFYPDNEKKFTFDFYKNKDFSGKPVYILNEKGLLKNNKLICEWDQPYSEKSLYLNFLPNCKNIHQFLGFYSPGGSGPISLCAVMNVEDYTIQENGDFLYSIRIGESPYFLDTRKMPRLKSGELFSSNEKRGGEFSKKLSEYSALIQKVKDSLSFKNLTHCILKKDLKCIDGYLSPEFLGDVASFQSICGGQGLPACKDAHSEKIKVHAYKYLSDFTNLINLLEIHRVDSFSNDSIRTKATINPDEEFLPYSIELKNDSILLKNVFDE